MRIGEYLEVVDSKQGKSIHCLECGHDFGSAQENPKEKAVTKDFSISKLGPNFRHSNRLVLREFYCPGCAKMFHVEVTRTDIPNPIGWDIKLDV